MHLSRRAATASGFLAVVLWSSLAALTARSGAVPPFQLAAMTFGVAGVSGCLVLGVRRELGLLRQPLAAWTLGVGGLFGYHALYFAALRAAPALEASLVAYLWPLLIVLLSALLPGERLHTRHVAGALAAFLGAVVIIGGSGVGIAREAAAGYALALGAACVWAGFSVLSRKFANVPSGAMAGFCLATAAASATLHLQTEVTAWPGTGGEWLTILLLGLGPVGAAFFFWDIGVKHGNIQVLGTASYAAPLLSSLLLILLGEGRLTVGVGLGAILIVAGAVVAGITPKHRSSRRRPTLSTPIERGHTRLRLERDPEPTHIERRRHSTDTVAGWPEAASDWRSA
jgi:drug/metabolite transporter (DMT)-like permease